MKIRNILNIIQEYGLLSCLKFLFSSTFFSNTYHSVIDRILGLDFMDVVDACDLKNSVPDSTAYYPSRRDVVRKIFRKYVNGEMQSFLDIGCGKGCVIASLASLPFEKLDGLECSLGLSKIAKKNINRLGITHAKIYEIDARYFDKYCDYTHIYLYNPFGPETFQVVMNNIESSLQQSLRKIYIVYANPICHNIIIKNGLFKLIEIWPESVDYGNSIYIYSNDMS